MTVKSGYSNYKRSASWNSCLSICALGILSGAEQKHGQISILLAPEMPPSPESSDITSAASNNCDSHSDSVIPSLSSSLSSLPSLVSAEKDTSKFHKDKEQHEPNQQYEYSPQLTSYNYFINRPLPTQRRSPGRNRNSSNKDSKLPWVSFFNNDYDTENCLTAPDSRVHGTETRFITEFIDKLKPKITSPTPVHPSLLKLVNDLLEYMNEVPSLTNELEQLKSKLEKCLLIHNKAVHYDS